MRLKLLMLLSGVALLQACSASMLRTSCSKPRVSNFGAPSSHIVMLPYRYGGSKPANADAAVQFNQLARLQALQGAAELKSTQITLVEGDPADKACAVEAVYDRVIDPAKGLFFWRRPFNSAIFVWGEIFDRGDSLLVQSHLRVFWNGASDRALEVSIDSPTLARPLKFGGDLPSETISFPAQLLSPDRQEQLRIAMNSELQVRQAPDSAAPVAALPTRIAAVAWKRPWLEIRDRARPEGTVWVLIEENGLDARHATPEAMFARALSSYLNFRVSPNADSRKRATTALAQFRTAFSPLSSNPQSRVPLALADVLEGTLGLPMAWQSLYSVDADDGALQSTVSPQAQAALSGAAQRLPGNGDVLNLAAIALIPGCCAGPDAAARVVNIDRMLVHAEALTRGNTKVAQNLVNWYAYLATLPDSSLPFSREEVLARGGRASASLAAWQAQLP